MDSSVEVLEQSATAGLVDIELPATGVLSTPVSPRLRARGWITREMMMLTGTMCTLLLITNKDTHLAETEIDTEEDPVSTSVWPEGLLILKICHSHPSNL